LLKRLTYVENQMKSFGTAGGGDYASLTEVARWMFDATHLRSRAKIELFPNSAPADVWYHYVPVTYIGSNLGTGGMEIRYAGNFNIGNPTFIKANLIGHYNGEPVTGSYRWFGGLGVAGAAYFSGF